MIKSAILIYLSPVITKDKRIVQGGAEIYIYELGKLLVEIGFDVTIIQAGDEAFDLEFDCLRVVSIKWKPKLFDRKPTTIIKHLLGPFDAENSIVIFGAESAAIRLDMKWRKILIQHGIGFDYPTSGKSLGLLRWLKNSSIGQGLVRWEVMRSADFADLVVCVDYVYPTWFKTQRPCAKKRLVTIPNFARATHEFAARNGYKKVLFARRMVERRGVLLFAEAVQIILQRGVDVEVTFSGVGEHRSKIECMFQKIPNVKFTDFQRTQEQGLNLEYDIAVVPSLASEGTSFSLLEAMASSCAVIATPIGGLTNIVIDRHNGLLVRPNASDIADAIELLRNNVILAERLAKNGYETIRDSFSYNCWSESWKKEIATIMR